MEKSTKYLVFGDQSWPAESLKSILKDRGTLSIWIDGKGWVFPSKSVEQDKGRKKTSSIKAAEKCKIPDPEKKNTIAIVGFENPESAEGVVSTLRSRSSEMKILRVGTKITNATLSQIRRSIAWKDLLNERVNHELELLSLQSKIIRLKKYLEDVKEVAILLQDDPDPDGLAGSLALRKILGRKAQTAPIVSFGKITRPENIAMADLLGIEVIQVDQEKLSQYEKVVLIDCQPSFFKGRKIKADVVIDHHPRGSEESLKDCEIVEIHEKLGAISTLLTLYLQSAGEDISQRLATALLYGIKSDTLMFNREVCEDDLDAFMFLYPKIKSSQLRRIERPELPEAYITSLRRGLRHLKTYQDIAVLPLIDAKKEEWIAQGADFISQIENNQWAIACALYNDQVILSGRHWGYNLHCGDMFKELFNEIGVAGGHKSMAKAIIEKKSWEEEFGESASRPTHMRNIIMRKVKAYLRKKKSEA